MPAICLPARLALALLLCAALAGPARAAGFREVAVMDPGHADIRAGLWYPSPDAPSEHPIDLMHQVVALDGAMAPGRHPLIVISHGAFGATGDHYDTAVALADAGYIVVAPTHTGDNWRDHSLQVNVMDRPRQISRVIDWMLDGWDGSASIDPGRIGAFGFSAGGFTILEAIGGRADFSKIAAYCADHQMGYTCALATQPEGTPPPEHADARIRAAVIAAPAFGFTFAPDGLRGVTIPVQLWRADQDAVLPPADYADPVHAALPSAEFHPVPSANHADFLAPCSDALAAAAPWVCTEIDGFDRTAFHARMNAAIVAFFNRTLPPG